MKPVNRVFVAGPHGGRYDSLLGGAGMILVEEPRDAEAAVAIGGDGTILRVMDEMLGTGLPVFGVNAGHLGFLADCELEHIEESLACLLSGDYKIDQLAVLEARAPGGFCGRALNEISINRAADGGILHIQIMVDGRVVAVVASDGILVSTPSGSTAYNLSCGGPILHPNLPVAIITAICPHLLAIRPLVVPLSSRIDFTILRSKGSNPKLLADGSSRCVALDEGDTVTVISSSLTCPVIRTGRRSEYYAMLGKKLGWGYRG